MSNIVTDKAVIERYINSSVKEENSKLLNLISQCGIGELYYFISGIRLQYVKHYDGEASLDRELLHLQLIDTYKYLIPTLAKEGVFDLNNVSVRMELIEELVETVKRMNSRNDAKISLNFLSKSELDIRTGKLFNHIDEFNNNRYKNKLLDYSIRIQTDVETGNELKIYESNINDFLSKYGDFNDLFSELFQMSIPEFLEFLNFLSESIFSRLDANIRTFSLDEEGIIDVNDPLNYLKFARIITFSKEELISFNPRAETVLNSYTLNTSTFNPLELRFDQVNDTPIIKIGSSYLINFELLLGAIHLNPHFAFLKNTSIKETYKTRMSTLFEDRIIEIAANHNYVLVDRGVWLYEGKNKLGDIDIILRSELNGKLLYVEAKCYSLISEVQAHNLRSILEQLKKQQDEWEFKVKRRKQKLESEAPGDTCNYIIVTKKPEVLSHFSDLLVLTLDEFEFWLQHEVKLDFEGLFKMKYNRRLKPETLEKLRPNVSGA